MQIVLPATAFTPTEAELKEIIEHGPYTEPLSDVYPLLQLPRVRDRPQLAARRPPLGRRIHRPPHTAGEKDFAALDGLLLRQGLRYFERRLRRAEGAGRHARAGGKGAAQAADNGPRRALGVP